MPLIVLAGLVEDQFPPQLLRPRLPRKMCTFPPGSSQPHRPPSRQGTLLEGDDILDLEDCGFLMVPRAFFDA